MRRVVITGLGTVTPIGVGRYSFWNAALAGANGVTALTSLPHGIPDMLGSRVIARVDESVLPPPDPAFRGDRAGWFARLAFLEALADAELEDLRMPDAGIIVGTAVGGTVDMESSYLQMDRGGALDATGLSNDLWNQVIFHDIAMDLATISGATGRVLTSSTGCTAGLDSIGLAYHMIRDGVSDVVAAGGTDAPLTPVVFAAFDVIGALSRRNDDPAHASRPFDRERDGFVLGEGAAMLVLEERNQARARGTHIYCEVTGFASSSNGYHMTNLPPDGQAIGVCFHRALDEAGLNPQDVDHVNAHGSSTPQNDLCETNAVKVVLGSHAESVTVNSLKSMVGHALGASNAIEVAACAFSLDRQHHFPTINFERPGEGCDLDYVANVARRAEISHLAKLSNGFSGIHSTLIMARRD